MERAATEEGATAERENAYGAGQTAGNGGTAAASATGTTTGNATSASVEAIADGGNGGIGTLGRLAATGVLLTSSATIPEAGRLSLVGRAAVQAH